MIDAYGIDAIYNGCIGTITSRSRYERALLLATVHLMHKGKEVNRLFWLPSLRLLASEILLPEGYKRCMCGTITTNEVCCECRS